MIDVDKLKGKIISFLEENGPAIPVKIAKEIKQEPVFASALLGELTQAKKVNTSHMRVGSSQIFYVPGQEEKLESFAEEFLGGVVKSAYLSLKEHKYLIDKDEEPKIRVALRSLKDFATAFMHNEEVMWRYNFTPKEEIVELLKQRDGVSEPEEKVEKVSEESKEDKEESQNVVAEEKEETSEPESEVREKEIIEERREEPEPKEVEDKAEDESEKLEEVEEEQKEPEPEVKPKTMFVKKPFSSPINEGTSEASQAKLNSSKPKPTQPLTEEVKVFLEEKGVKLVEVIEESKSECVAIVSVSGDLGETQYFLIARNKKTINDSDLRVAKSRAYEKHMPCYLLHKGKLTKGAQTFLEEVGNLVKVDVIS